MIYTAKDVYNQVMKIKKGTADGGHLEKYLTDIELNGGTVKWSKSESGEVLVFVDSIFGMRD